MSVERDPVNEALDAMRAALQAIVPLRGGKRDHSYCPFCRVRTDVEVNTMADLWGHEAECPYVKALPFIQPVPPGEWSAEGRKAEALRVYQEGYVE